MKLFAAGLLSSVVLLIGSSAFAQASCEPGEPAPGMPPGFEQFAFIVGDFDVVYRQRTDDGWSEPLGRAHWNGRYTLDGRAIMDWWYEEGAEGPAGVNLRMFDPDERVWKTAWHYTGNYEVRELRQRVWEEDGRLQLW